MNGKSSPESTDDVASAAQDFSYYFKAKPDMMKKLETSKPLRNTKAAGKKKAEKAITTKKGGNEGQTYLFRWQRGKGNAKKNGDTSDAAGDVDDADDEPAEKKGPSIYAKITGNLPPSSLSISIYVGKQDSKKITAKGLNQALYHSGKAKGTVASPQEFEAMLASEENAGTGRPGISRDERAKRTKSFKGIDIDQFENVFEENDETGPQWSVLKLRQPGNWPPLPPKFPPPPPDESEDIQPIRVMRVAGSFTGTSKQGSGSRKKSVTERVGGSGVRGKISFSEGMPLDTITELKDGGKKAANSGGGGWRRRLSFMPTSSRTSNMGASEASKIVYTTTSRVPWVIPPPPDPPRAPRPGSNDELKQAEKNLLFMFVEDMYSQLVELEIEKFETSKRCAELEEQIAQAEETVAAMLSASEADADAVGSTDDKIQRSATTGSSVSAQS